MTTQFIDTDSADIYNGLMERVSIELGEPLHTGDERRIYSEVIAQILTGVHNTVNDAAMQRMLNYARGENLDGIGVWMGVERLEGKYAYDEFRFYVEAAQTTDIEIPESTRVTYDGVTYFATEETVVLRAGDAYVQARCVCLSEGTDYNDIPAGTINILVDLVPYIARVENLHGTTGGDDGEPYTEDGDNHYRERIRIAPAAFSTAGSEDAYRYHAMSSSGNLMDVYVESPTPCQINLYPIMVDGRFATEQEKADIATAVNKRTVRPLGDQITILDPEVVEYDIEMKYYCTEENEKTAVLQVEAEGGAIDEYNMWQQGTLGRHIVPDALRRLMYSSRDGELFYVERVEIKSPAYTELERNQIARFSGNLTVTHETLEDYQ